MNTFRSRATTTAVACTLLAACGPQMEGNWPAGPAARPGKADAVVLVNGASISSSHVNPSRYYLSHRSVDSLAQVGALTGAMESVADRVDGIIASLPADGYVSIDEMERMEQPAYFSTLFADEQAAFILLWRLLEMPDQAPVQLIAPAGMDLTVTDTTVEPGALTFAPSEPIDTLPQQLQVTARRLQLAFDSDGDQDTVSFADLDQGENDPLGRFTPNDVYLFGKIRDELRRRGTSQAEARVDVPRPGDTEHDLVLGDLTLRVTRSVRYDESRRIAPGRYSGSWYINLALHHETVVSAHLPGGVSALLIDEATGDELVLVDGQTSARLPAATYLVELWSSGARIATARAQLPELVAGKGNVNLDQFADHSFYAPGGDKLVRNPTEAKFKYNSSVGVDSYYWARYTHDLTARPYDPAQVEPRALQEVATFEPALPPGRYELTASNAIGTFFVDIYPEGVIYTVRQGVKRWMRPRQLDYKKKFDSSFAQGLHRVVFDPSNRELWTHRVDGSAADLRVTLSSLHRI